MAKAHQKSRKPKVGRPRLDPEGVMEKCAVKLTPAEIDFVRSLGGSVNTSLRSLVVDAMARANAGK